MRRSREEAAATREHIVETASQEFRANGIAKTGLAEVMKTAGLTHGGFYKHFESKDQLLTEAVELAFDQILGEFQSSIQGKPPKAALATLVRQYLSAGLRDDVERACPLSAIGTELRRADPGTGEVVLNGMQKLVSLIAEQITDRPRRQARARAHGIASAMVGGIVLSRLARNRHLADSILRDTREFVLRSK
jgi:TetR/AcrR family transcriptional regulator, transcriptional repressor for nem operon